MKKPTHYSIFFDWLFDGNIKSEIPRTDDIDLLKYNSPINETFIIKMFIQNGKLNNYLNQHFNNLGIRYIEKEDLFRFVKQCVKDFKVKRKDVHYFPWKPRVAVFEKLRKKLPLFKDHEISTLVDKIQKSKDKGKFYSALGIEAPKEKKIKKKKQKKKSFKISVDDFLKENFKLVEVES